MFKAYVTFLGALYCAALAINVAAGVREQIRKETKEGASNEA